MLPYLVTNRFFCLLGKETLQRRYGGGELPLFARWLSGEKAYPPRSTPLYRVLRLVYQKGKKENYCVTCGAEEKVCALLCDEEKKYKLLFLCRETLVAKHDRLD